jgi:hypothetical protein
VRNTAPNTSSAGRRAGPALGRWRCGRTGPPQTNQWAPINLGMYVVHMLLVDNLVKKATKIFYENIKVLLFEYEKYKGLIFKNYNIDKHGLKFDYGEV